MTKSNQLVNPRCGVCEMFSSEPNKRRWSFLFCFCIILIVSNNECCQLPSPEPQYVIQTNRLPEDLNFMPNLCNGHLGFTVFGDSIFMNGVYNGFGGNSRRARIPNWINVSAIVEEYRTTTKTTSYLLDVKNGYFQWHQSTLDEAFQITQRTYAHRYFNRALIYEFQIDRKNAEETLTITMNKFPGANSSAFDFDIVPHNASKATTILQGVTKTIENVDFQKEPRTIFIAFSENLGKKKILKMLPGQQTLSYRFIITIGNTISAVIKELQNGKPLRTDTNIILEISLSVLTTNDLFGLHTSEWQKFWQSFNIEIEGNFELQQTINAGIFYLANSLPSLHTNQPNNPYYGLSPTGLGRGNRDEDYEGHNFWDTEIWMLPVITQLNVNWTKDLFNYRFRNLAAAKYNAKKSGYKGARFPWESAYTGTEVVNPCCPQIGEQEIHISPDIAYAAMQFYHTSLDRDWLCEIGLNLISDIGEFLIDRVTKDKFGKYHIKDVMGPDEDHSNVDDNVYTNVITRYALQSTFYAANVCRTNISTNWQEIADNLVVLYDSILDYHPQHKNYKKGDQIKQADVVLLGYPLLYSMNKSTHANDLEIYENVTRSSGPAMTWSIFAINSLIAGKREKANEYFFKGYKDYVRTEFKVWSETKRGFHGSANFLTGIGGFLQAIINGYAGIRYNFNNPLYPLEWHTPQKVPSTLSYSVKGIKFAESTFYLKLSSNGESSIKVTHVGRIPLILKDDIKTFKLYKGFQYIFHNSVLQIGPDWQATLNKI